MLRVRAFVDVYCPSADIEVIILFCPTVWYTCTCICVRALLNGLHMPFYAVLHTLNTLLKQAIDQNHLQHFIDFISKHPQNETTKTVRFKLTSL